MKKEPKMSATDEVVVWNADVSPVRSIEFVLYLRKVYRRNNPPIKRPVNLGAAYMQCAYPQRRSSDGRD